MADKKDEHEAIDEAAARGAEGAEWVDDDGSEGYDGNVWIRGLFMLILAILFHVAEGILVLLAVLQFLWLLFSKEKNQFLVGTGDTIGRWMMAVARFQTGATEDKPFPWRRLD